MGVFNLCHSGMRGTIRVYYTVAKEVSVTRGVYSIVTTIGIIFTSILIFFQDTLVHPVPDESALQVRVFIDSFPLIP